jgi:hypothetical protein
VQLQTFFTSRSIEVRGQSIGRSGKLLLVLASTVIFGSGSRGTHDHILLSHDPPVVRSTFQPLYLRGKISLYPLNHRKVDGSQICLGAACPSRESNSDSTVVQSVA